MNTEKSINEIQSINFKDFMDKMGYSWADFDNASEMESLINWYADEKVKNFDGLVMMQKVDNVFNFCKKGSPKEFADFLYADDHEKYVGELQDAYGHHLDCALDFSDDVTSKYFYNTLQSTKEKYDSDGYYRDLHDNNPYALMITEIAMSEYDMSDFFEQAKKYKVRLKTTANRSK